MAEGEAAALRHAEVGTEHLLLGLLREGRGLATRALRELGVEPAELTRRLRARLVPAELAVVGALDYSPLARSALDHARAEAERLAHDYVGTEHLLLGLLRDGEGPAFMTLVGAGVTLGRARQQIARLIDESPPSLPGGRSPGLALLRGHAGSAERSRGAGAPGGETGDDAAADRCARCSRPGRPDWRFCAFCGERVACCDRCDAPLPRLAGVRFCPSCGVMRGDAP